MKNHRILAALVLFLGANLVSFAADAKANWDEKCATCHGADGKGETKMGKRLKILNLQNATVQAG
ncbi:MAG: c-type cytochrome, partial [Opitutales bacterium]